MAILDELWKSKTPAPVANVDGNTTGIPGEEEEADYSDEELLALHEKCKREAFFQRQVFERQWTRNIWYVLGRQWIEYYKADGQWKDTRLAKWIPRPVTQKAKETVQAIRAMLTAINLGVTARPNGEDPKNISVASTCDELFPLHRQNYKMNHVMSEFDWWLIVTGNAFLYTYWDYDVRHGMITVGVMECMDCGYSTTEDKIQGMQPVCPECGSANLQPAVDEVGQPRKQRIAKGKGVTDPLSPLELVFPNSYARFDEVPYVYRLRWRTKAYFENHPTLKNMVREVSWSKTPQDRSLQIFKALSTQNDLGINPSFMGDGTSSGDGDEGATEYELWYKPCDKYPDGLVARFIGEKSPVVLHLEEEEAVPGPFPYVDADKMPVFPFAHAGYDHVGGRILASGALDPVIQKFDQINQLDSMFLMIVMRMANPVWLEPKGAEIEKLTGEPGLVIKWNPLSVMGSNAKPERIAGEGPHGSLFTLREMYLKDIEEITGTYDIIKGAKPTGVEAFSALALLDERSKSRFASLFQSRADAYAHTAKVQLELEREFGPDKITMSVLSPAKRWSYKNFKKADLQGNVTVIVENGTQTPKSNLGRRAAIEHLNTLGFINPQDPDQKYKIFSEFGMAGLSPSLDIDVTAALQKQEAFEEWIGNDQVVQQWAQQQVAQQQQFEVQQAEQNLQFATELSGDPEAMAPMPMVPPSPLVGTPLEWNDWYSPAVHEIEFLKWANGDVVRELLVNKPEVRGLLKAHLMEIRIAKMEQLNGVIGGQLLQIEQPSQAAVPGKKKDNGSPMSGSNRESTQGNEPKGSGEGAQNRGPA
jgi:hypothetical protein